MSVDYDRLIDRVRHRCRHATIAEGQRDAALRYAQYLTRPRATLIDENRRLVRVVNSPEEARRDPPRIPSRVTSAGWFTSRSRT